MEIVRTICLHSESEWSKKKTEDSSPQLEKHDKRVSRRDKRPRPATLRRHGLYPVLLSSPLRQHGSINSWFHAAFIARYSLRSRKNLNYRDKSRHMKFDSFWDEGNKHYSRSYRDVAYPSIPNLNRPCHIPLKSLIL